MNYKQAYLSLILFHLWAIAEDFQAIYEEFPTEMNRHLCPECARKVADWSLGGIGHVSSFWGRIGKTDQRLRDFQEILDQIQEEKDE